MNAHRSSRPRRRSKTPAPGKVVELSVVMPCLNEARTVGTCIRKAQRAMDRMGIHGEVIVSDNGSTDGSPEIANRLGARIVRESRKGYGSALLSGCRSATGRFIIMGDADDSYDFSDLEPFVEKLKGGSDLVMGSRLRGRIMPGAMPWKNRFLGNPVLTRVLRWLFRAKISDAHCGMRGFSKRSFELMDLRSPGMEFASEMIIKAARLGLSISEVPITFYRDGRGRRPHLRPWRDAWRHMKLMLMYSPTALFLVPGAFLLTGGLGMIGAQLFAPADGPLILFGIRFDIHWAILGSVLAIVGYQVITVHFFAKVYSVTHRLRETDRLLARAFRLLTLERVLTLSAIVIVVGLVIDGIVLVRWLRTDFGPLVAGSTRQFIFGSTLFALGVQTFFNAFFFSILGDAYRYERVNEPPDGRDGSS
jgi:hypothetical protein